jgi:hypothetical protein
VRTDKNKKRISAATTLFSYATLLASRFARRRRKIEQQNEQLEVLLTEVNTLRAESSSSLKNDSETVKQLKTENEKLREVRTDKNMLACVESCANLFVPPSPRPPAPPVGQKDVAGRKVNPAEGLQ